MCRAVAVIPLRMMIITFLRSDSFQSRYQIFLRPILPLHQRQPDGGVLRENRRHAGFDF